MNNLKCQCTKFASLILVSLLITSCQNAKSDNAISEDSTILVSERAPAPVSANAKYIYCMTQDSVGVGGHDLLSYFTKGIAEKGSAQNQYTHEGLKYNFVSEEHLQKFKSEPGKYLPKFGGWCSMTLAMGRATTPTYDNFRIINDTLYLFEKTLSINGQTLWLQSPDENKNTAQRNYDDFTDDGVISPEE